MGTNSSTLPVASSTSFRTSSNAQFSTTILSIHRGFQEDGTRMTSFKSTKTSQSNAFFLTKTRTSTLGSCEKSSLQTLPRLGTSVRVSIAYLGYSMEGTRGQLSTPQQTSTSSARIISTITCMFSVRVAASPLQVWTHLVVASRSLKEASWRHSSIGQPKGRDRWYV